MLSKPNALKDNEIPSLDFVPEGFVPIESHTSSQNQQPIELDYVLLRMKLLLRLGVSSLIRLFWQVMPLSGQVPK